MRIMMCGCRPSDMADRLRGKNVLIWTCDTCARLCKVGGSAKARGLARYLESEGIRVTGIVSEKACCVMGKNDNNYVSGTDADIVLVLACGVASHLAEKISGKPVFNPLAVLGEGYLDTNGHPVLVDKGTEKGNP